MQRYWDKFRPMGKWVSRVGKALTFVGTGWWDGCSASFAAGKAELPAVEFRAVSAFAIQTPQQNVKPSHIYRLFLLLTMQW